MQMNRSVDETIYDDSANRIPKRIAMSNLLTQIDRETHTKDDQSILLLSP